MWDGKGSYGDYLEHHGVKGMKWGVRKARSSVSSMRKAYEKRKKAKDVSFTEGQGAKADKLMTQKDRRRNMEKLRSGSTKREKDWNKLYLKREKMGDRELQLALNRLKLENQFAKEVKAASEVSPPPKSFLQKHRAKIVVASKGTEMISNVLLSKDKDNVNAQLAKTLSKTIGGALSGGESKKK